MTARPLPREDLDVQSPTDWIRQLPKAELHLHLEGTLEPEMMLALAERNRVKLRFSSVEEIRAAYQFERLDDFLAIYYQGMSVLQTEQDFYDLTLAYLERARQDGVVHAEVFFDPQGHTRRGVPIDAVIRGITGALREGERSVGVSSRLILCFLRDLSEDDALDTLASAQPYREYLAGVGLDSSEVGHPPSRFRRAFDAARSVNLHCVAHAGEEGPPEYVREALDILRVERVDHGNRALEDAELAERLRTEQVPLTVCPLSNQRLGSVRDLRKHPLKRMLELGLCATVNSDDPAYFGGYVHDNFVAVCDNLQLTNDHVIRLAQNSFRASFLDAPRIAEHLRSIDRYCADAGIAN
jgi:adenosine deaminase